MNTDPLALVWVATAARLGLRIRRSNKVFASIDGEGRLWLGSPDTLDPDDHVAQMVLHEICHWVVNGADAVEQVDWGFPPMEGLDWREYPTLRLQLLLARRHGLTELFAPTTQAKAYWERLVDPTAPLDESPREQRIVTRTREALARVRGAPWQPALDEALHATAQLVRIAERISGERPLSPRPPPRPPGARAPTSAG